MQKNVTNTFNPNEFQTQIHTFLVNLPKNRHYKLSYELLYASVGHLNPVLHPFLCKIIFCKILNFTKKNVINIFHHDNFQNQICTFLFDLPKNRHFKLSYELLQASVGNLSPDLHQFLCKIYLCKILNFVKKNCQNGLQNLQSR